MLTILRETKDYIVVCKPSGLITESNIYEDSLEDRVKEYLEKTRKKPFIGVVHRLDKVTSGVVIFAKKKSALLYFNQLFELKNIKKTYLAVSFNPESNKKITLNHFIYKDTKNKKALISLVTAKLYKPCSLSMQPVKKNGEFTLFKILPRTGRFHQIRAQLSFINQTILGDIKYGSKIEINEGKNICLHAHSLSFIDFNSEEKCFVSAPIPDTEYWNLFEV